MSKTMYRAAIGAIVILAMILGGCSAHVSIGRTQTLHNPDAGLASLLSPTPRSVTCPGNISADAGTRFTCKVVAANGDRTTLTVLENKPGTVKIIDIGGRPIAGLVGAGH
jgi:hypothetical protein